MNQRLKQEQLVESSAMNYSYSRRDFLKLGVGSVLGLTVIPFLKPMQSALAQTSGLINDNKVEPIKAAPPELFYDYSKEGWTQKWWQWAYSIKKEQNPILDETGLFVQNHQPAHENVFFLSGGYQEEPHVLERTIKIPANKGLIIPAINSEWSYAELAEANTVRDLNHAATMDIDHTTIAFIRVDGKSLPLERITTEPFYLNINQQNYFAYATEVEQHRLKKDGLTTAISDGYWAFLQPLSTGKHTIHIKGETKDSFCKDYENEVIYKVDVV
jgi:hypothetical protein